MFATFLKGNFAPPPGFSITIVANKGVISAVNEQVGDGSEFKTFQGGKLRLTASNLKLFWDALIKAMDEGADLGDWVDSELQAVLDLYKGSVGSGFRLLEPLRPYHSPSSTADYAEQVLSELVNGKIAIVDLSLGSDIILRFCSERIVNHILQNAARRFADGLEAHQIQIYIEEAHRLFNRDRMNVPAEADPYVRLAKEAAKYKIGLIYATQEVSSVDPLILSNTSNWIVTHLNNRNEVKELSKYYDFQDFQELTLKAEDVGFARVKTRSGRYIIPMQIDLFSESRVQAAREACLHALEQQVEGEE
ncbi:MAG: hypothetical protein AB1402_04185 [Bacillota bacterium]